MRLRIDVEYLADQLSKLLAIPSPSGYTDNVVRYCTEELQRLGLKPELTRRGAIRAIRPGLNQAAARAIVSHLDTLGAQVKRVKENGRLELVPIGHWSARFAEGARVTLFSEKGSYRGTILPLKASGHTFNKEVDSQPVGWEYVELRVDAYTRAMPETLALGIDIGDIVAIDPQPEFLGNGFIVSRHLDNKAGVASMLAALQALQREGSQTEVDTHWLFTISEEVGVGASSILTHDVASLVAVDNGTSAAGQKGPFDYHLTLKLVKLCREFEIRFQKDVFRYYRSDSASAVEAGSDVRTALVTFGVDASHGYERINIHALRSLAELLAVYATSSVEIRRDAEEMTGLKGFTKQPTREASQPDVTGMPTEK